MAEHNSSDNEDRDGLPDVEEELDSLITNEPFIHWQRRRAIRQADEARQWAEENPDLSEEG